MATRSLRSIRRIAASGMLACTALTGVAAFQAAPAHAAAVEINSGWCQTGLPSWQHPYLAPGVYGNGPFVIVDGKFVSTNGNGFDGFTGCYK